MLGSNDPDNPALIVPLLGVGSLPDIALAEDTLAFGDVILTVDSVSFIRILNTGGVDLTVTDIALLDTPDQFALIKSAEISIQRCSGRYRFGRH